MKLIFSGQEFEEYLVKRLGDALTEPTKKAILAAVGAQWAAEYLFEE